VIEIVRTIINIRSSKSLTGIVKSLILMGIFISLMVFPKEVFEASLRGLNTWWNIVFPALLPFFIVSNLMMSFGIVHFLSVLLEPVMRPIFNVPGNGAFVMAMGYTSGFPIGAVLTTDLRRKSLCTRNEGERLACFTNNASPLFMFGAVAIGMFQNPQLGAVIAISHYTANLCIGVMLRFHGYNDPEQTNNRVSTHRLISRSIDALLSAQRKNNTPLGQQLGDAVKKGIQTLSIIGGFIILFSVILEVLLQLGIIPIISNVFGQILLLFNFNEQLAQSLAAGLFEVTIGAKSASEINAPLYQQLIIVSVILGWSGLSVHAQIASFIGQTDLRLWPFIISRLAHGILAACFISILIGPAQPVFRYFHQPNTITSAHYTLLAAVLIPLLLSIIFIVLLIPIAMFIVLYKSLFGLKL